MERSNQPPKTECCREEGQAGVAAGDSSRTTSWKRTQGTTQAASGCRTRLSYPAPKQSSMQVGTPSHQRNPTRRQPLQVRLPETCRGRSAWHAKKEPRETWDALKRPDAPTAGANREGTFNDKKNDPSQIRESDRFIVAGTIRAKEPTPSRSPHRNQRRKNDGTKLVQPPCGP